VKKKPKAGTSKRSAAEKKRLWVEAMITNGGNATKAAESAGFTPGRAAEQAGYRLSKDVVATTLLEQRRAEVLAEARKKTQLTADEVLESLARDIRFDPAKLYDEHGKLKPIHEIDEDTRLAMRGLEVDEITERVGDTTEVVGYTTKAKFPEKTAAREQGMKHFGLYDKDNRQKADPIIALLAAIETKDQGFQVKR
jgi:phage terminase small subunit